MIAKWAYALLLCAPLIALAQTPQPLPEDPVANKRAVQLAEKLRCLVCQNQSIADSNAELAVDLRRQIREQVAQGRSDAEIVDYMVQRYGDFVLYRPPVKAITLLLWFGPPALLLLGLIVLIRYLRERRQRIATLPLTESERREAQSLLRENSEGGRS
jgi:cytochrome c-type biogenesis protein CcmH